MKRILVFIGLILVLGAAGAGFYYFQAGTSTGDSSAQNSSDSSKDADATAADGQDDENAEQGENGEGKNEEEDGKAAVPVNVVDARVGEVSTYITATANIVPEDDVTVLAEAEGRVTRLDVEEGDSVTAGQLLATLLRDEAKILLEKAKLKAENARLAYERAERMFGQELIAQEEYDKITMDHRIAQQELAEAEWGLAKTEIRAPFDGRVTKRNIMLGQHVRPGDELFQVTNFDPLISRIYLPEKDVLSLNPGRSVDITLKADENVQFKGKIQMISPVVDTATGTVKVTVEALNPPSVVRPGGFVIIDIVRETRSDTLVLPREAVIRELKNAHVFVVKDNVAEKRVVRVGLEEDEKIEILEGVEPGERIVVAGQGSLKDGSKIKVLEDNPATRAANLGPRDRQSWG